MYPQSFVLSQLNISHTEFDGVFIILTRDFAHLNPVVHQLSLLNRNLQQTTRCSHVVIILPN
jgi:hypothetical protein